MAKKHKKFKKGKIAKGATILGIGSYASTLSGAQIMGTLGWMGGPLGAAGGLAVTALAPSAAEIVVDFLDDLFS